MEACNGFCPDRYSVLMDLAYWANLASGGLERRQEGKQCTDEEADSSAGSSPRPRSSAVVLMSLVATAGRSGLSQTCFTAA